MKFKQGEEVISTKGCPYAAKGGLFRITRIIDSDLIEVYVKEHKKKFFVGRMFKARPWFFEKAVEEVPTKKEEYFEELEKEEIEFEDKKKEKKEKRRK